MTSIEHTVLVIRYTTGSALALSIWDILTTLDNEVAYIWPLPFGPLKFLYFFVRYGNVASLIYANHIYSGIVPPSNDVQCKAFQATYDCLIVLYSFLYNAFVALRVYTIWDHRASVRIILCVALAIVHIPVFVLGIESVITYTRNTIFAPAPLNVCIVTKESNLVKVAYGCVLIYDLFVMCLATCNALDRPRGPQHKLITNLHRDGAIWFLILFALRLANFLFFLLLPVSQLIFVIFLTWSMISLTLARMIVRIESTKRPFMKANNRKLQVKTWVPSRDAFELENANWAQGTSSMNTNE